MYPDLQKKWLRGQGCAIRVLLFDTFKSDVEIIWDPCEIDEEFAGIRLRIVFWRKELNSLN